MNNGVPPGIDDVVHRHSKWLMKKLYDSRERNGDVVFVVKKPVDEGQIEVPVPGGDVEMRDD